MDTRPARPTQVTDHRRARAPRLCAVGATIEAGVTPGILPSALRASQQLFQIGQGDLVKIDILTCAHCGGAVKVSASIEAPVVIKKILDHRARRAEAVTAVFRPFARAPPQPALPGLKQPG